MLLGELVGDKEWVSPRWANVQLQGLASDTRHLREGFLFAALSGSHLDGSLFIADACRRGAAALLVREKTLLPAGLNVPVVFSANPRRSLAFMASRFYREQPGVTAAVTGTNGKTTVCSFLRQIWESCGICAASMGTVGLVTQGRCTPLRHTTPDPIEMHRYLDRLARDGVSHLAFESSSHGLAQNRIDGVRLSVAGFTNISRDHLDYHGDFEDYLLQKLRLFTEILPVGGTAVINADADHAERFIQSAERRGIRVFTVGERGKTLTLLSRIRTGFGYRLKIGTPDGREYEADFPLAGDFQVSNGLVAAGLAVASGLELSQVLAAFSTLEGVVGRLEMVATTPSCAPVFVDYAHTPDALRKVLESLRPYANRRLMVVFGAGGDRDLGKRALMGEIAHRYADIVIVTDDNPRTEDAAAIRADILAAAPDAIEIGDRGTAIFAGVKMLRQGDVLVVAGKGHETGQQIGKVTVAFSDHTAICAAMEGLRCRA